MFETKKKCQESREKREKEFLKKVEERISQLDIAYPSPYIEATEEEEEVLPELTPEIEVIINIWKFISLYILKSFVFNNFIF